MRYLNPLTRADGPWNVGELHSFCWRPDEKAKIVFEFMNHFSNRTPLDLVCSISSSYLTSLGTGTQALPVPPTLIGSASLGNLHSIHLTKFIRLSGINGTICASDVNNFYLLIHHK